jgi:hypothetical protein
VTPLAAIAQSDRDALNEMLAEDVVFHSPVQTYRGRELIIRLLVTIGGIIEEVQVKRELDGATFFTAQVGEHPGDGVLEEHTDDEGSISELMLMLRPLAQLQAAVARMARALAPIPGSRSVLGGKAG